jgi:hypothetical protein
MSEELVERERRLENDRFQPVPILVQVDGRHIGIADSRPRTLPAQLGSALRIFGDKRYVAAARQADRTQAAQYRPRRVRVDVVDRGHSAESKYCVSSMLTDSAVLPGQSSRSSRRVEKILARGIWFYPTLRQLATSYRHPRRSLRGDGQRSKKLAPNSPRPLADP